VEEDSRLATAAVQKHPEIVVATWVSGKSAGVAWQAFAVWDLLDGSKLRADRCALHVHLQKGSPNHVASALMTAKDGGTPGPGASHVVLMSEVMRNDTTVLHLGVKEHDRSLLPGGMVRVLRSRVADRGPAYRGWRRTCWHSMLTAHVKLGSHLTLLVVQLVLRSHSLSSPFSDGAGRIV